MVGTQCAIVLTVSTTFSNAMVASGLVPVSVVVASAVSAATFVNVVCRAYSTASTPVSPTVTRSNRRGVRRGCGT